MRLFLYGTLQPAARTRIARWLAPKIETAVPATVAGRLVAVPADGGWYPALLAGDGRCRGTLVKARLTADDVAALDRYEGSEYRRGSIEVRCADGTSVASTYVWHGAPPPSSQDIPDGDFLAWLERRNVKPFGT